MGIASMILRRSNQTAVYWGNPRTTGYGGEKEWDDPIDLAPPTNGVRWEDRIQVMTDDNGQKHISRAVVFLNQDVDVEGLLYLGTLADLEAFLDSSAGTYIDPNENEIPNLCIIKRFEKIPSLTDPTIFLRKAFLTPWLT